MPADPPASRAQRTRDTRDQIAGAAMDLFAEHGYVSVSVAAVARAAGVTEKTVFNHFGTKAELVYSNDEPFEDALVRAVSQRAPGVPAVRAAATFLLDRYARMMTDTGSRQRQHVISRLVATSQDLRDHERHVLDRYATSLAALLAEEQGAEDHDLRPHVVARSVLAVHRTVIDAFRKQPPGPVTPDQHSDVVRAAQDAFALLSSGMSAYARTPPGGARTG